MLPSGTQLGAYEIRSLLGSGGMGEVYQARDSRLSRDVAVKVLRGDVANDPGRLERLRREAVLLASVTHPNVGVIHGLEEANGMRFLVLELVTGETLADRLAHGPLKTAQALSIARQIAEAVEAAHDRGVVHRDLKPGNIKISADGIVKVLDFGLAKAVTTDVLDADVAPMPTMTQGSHGAVLVVRRPLSPEQARGLAVDKRTDIWAFGCLLYEMLAGRRAFAGATTSDVIAAVLDREPDWQPLPADLPRPMLALLRRCLQKDPRARLRDIGDARLEIGEALAAGSDALSSAGVSRTAARWWPTATVACAALLAGALIAAAVRRAIAPRPDPIQFTLPPPDTFALSFQGGPPQMAASPDGRRIAFVVVSHGTTALWLRDLSAGDPRPVPGTDGALFPFWSPDSRSLGFFAQGKLKKLQVGADAPTTICTTGLMRGATWNLDDIIVFAAGTAQSLQQVAASGGTPTAVALSDHGLLRWPHFLPDGRHFLYVSYAPEGGSARIGSLESTDVTTVMPSEAAIVYASGHLLFWRSGDLFAQPFDAANRRLSGDAVQIANQVAFDPGWGYAGFSASGGLLVFARGSTRPQTRLAWVDRTGQSRQAIGEPGEYINVSLSPDGQRAAVSLQSGTPLNRDIWIVDLARAASTRFTFHPAADAMPVWSPDGKSIVFNSQRSGPNYDLYQRPSNGLGQDDLLVKSDTSKYPSDWSRDGRFILFSVNGRSRRSDLWVQPLDGDRRPRPVLETPANEDNAQFSPDGQWIAYVSDESDQNEVYVQQFPVATGKWQVSRHGGMQPLWRGDGKELFFLAPDATLMAAAVDTSNGFETTTAQALFPSGIPLTGTRRQYAVARDGQHFLMTAADRSSTIPLTVVVNWLATLHR